MNNCKAKRGLIVAAIFVTCVILVALFGSMMTLHNPTETDLSKSLLAPSSMYPFGTDKLGRCIYSRIMAGAANTILSSLFVALLSMVFGTVLGSSAALIGGKYETAVMAVTSVTQSFPKFILIVALAGILGNSLRNSIIALFSVFWVNYARLSRSLVLDLKNSDYVRAARICGAGVFRIIRTHILPAIIGPLIVTCMLDICTVVLDLSALSYLGLGAAKPAIEWGSMMSEAKQTMRFAPWGILFPGIMVFVVVSAFNYFGEKIGEMIYESE